MPSNTSSSMEYSLTLPRTRFSEIVRYQFGEY